ncbi:zinc ABC transporter substrate-binding protein [Vibrio sp. DW001]|uniref:zinc ABC transporter substrate-binding protein n=1 Tax=Vibrio sp. DW001 TaxID=2912315 RepID=UPI0023AEE0C0|nr:zinc ABC transporter substrate-binding protein [Vibrio sp. DW001]WED25770.1 zinc ABC transporter substrate-binding protein [Vibrio sp. DW001]
MLKKALLGTFISLATSSLAHAQVPKVAVDIAPLHSLVTQVMGEVGKPELLIRPEASPHEYALRPSEAKALSEADIVFWIGEGLTPWLEKPLTSLAGSAIQIEMTESKDTTLYDFREGATFEGHEEHKEHGDKHDHDHEQHHEEESDEAEHHHHHEGHDPHAWLDPKNAAVWVNTILEALVDADPEHAQAYQDNAKATIARLSQLTTDIEKQANDLKGIKFIVFHDAYQYFEQRFNLTATGAISLSDASDPSPARVKEIRQTVKDLGVSCVFTEPQYNPKLVNTVFEGSTVTTIGTMDPIGADIAIGSDQYTSLLIAMINSLKQCQ